MGQAVEKLVISSKVSYGENSVRFSGISLETWYQFGGNIVFHQWAQLINKFGKLLLYRQTTAASWTGQTCVSWTEQFCLALCEQSLSCSVFKYGH